MSCTKLGKIPLYRICTNPSKVQFPGCIHSYVVPDPSYSPAQARAFRHLSAIHMAYESNISGCLIMEECIDLVNSLWNWRFSMDFIWNQANKCQSKRAPVYIMQLYSDHFQNIRRQVEVFQNTHQWFSPRTLMDTGGLKCYYIHRNAMKQIIQLYSTYSGWKLDAIQDKNMEMIVFYLPAIAIQFPIFTELFKNVARDNFNYILQQSMPMLFNRNIPPHIPIIPFCAKILLNGFREESFQDPADFKLRFLSDLFRNTHIWPYEVVRDWNEANILIELPEHSTSLVHSKPWKCAIQCATEKVHYPFGNYHINISDSYQSELCMPSLLFSIYRNQCYSILRQNKIPLFDIDTIPSHVCYLEMNEPPASEQLRECIDKCLDLGLVHSYGSYKQNYVKSDTVHIKDYQFVICDNDQTDLLVEAYLHRCVPIVTKSNVALIYLNRDAFLWGDYLYENMQSLVRNGDLYLKKANSARISANNASAYERYHMANLQIQMNLLLSRQFSSV